MSINEVYTGLPVWASMGSFGWRPAMVLAVSRTRVLLAFETGRRTNGRRKAEQLRMRDPRKRGTDKPLPGGGCR